jgi:hypothetical protein
MWKPHDASKMGALPAVRVGDSKCGRSRVSATESRRPTLKSQKPQTKSPKMWWTTIWPSSCIFFTQTPRRMGYEFWTSNVQEANKSKVLPQRPKLLLHGSPNSANRNQNSTAHPRSHSSRSTDPTQLASITPSASSSPRASQAPNTGQYPKVKTAELK